MIQHVHVAIRYVVDSVRIFKTPNRTQKSNPKTQIRGVLKVPIQTESQKKKCKI